MDGVCDIAPAFNLGGGKQAGDVDEADRVPAHPSALGEDQAGAGSLPIVLDLQLVREMSGISRSAPRHRCHGDAVFELDLTEPVGSEEGQDQLPFSTARCVPWSR